MKSQTVYVLSEKPLVLTGSLSTFRNVARLPGAFTYLYHNPGWIRGRNLWRWWMIARPFDRRKKRIIFVTNEESEARWLRLLRRPAICLGHNLHVCEGFFRPQAGIPQDFDAVYTARLSPQKRLHLAADVQRLCVITYSIDGKPWNLAAFEPSVAHATWNRRFLSDDEVRCYYQRSACGLALSASEGAMFASAEYLCCDLPVVTTPSRGGRDRYFDPAYVKTVPAEPGAVGRAVEEWTRQRPAPGVIRAALLEKLKADRTAFVHLMRDHCGLPVRNVEQEVERLWGGERGIERLGVPDSDLRSLTRV